MHTEKASIGWSFLASACGVVALGCANQIIHGAGQGFIALTGEHTTDWVIVSSLLAVVFLGAFAIATSFLWDAGSAADIASVAAICAGAFTLWTLSMMRLGNEAPFIAVAAVYALFAVAIPLMIARGVQAQPQEY